MIPEILKESEKYLKYLILIMALSGNMSYASETPVLEEILVKAEADVYLSSGAGDIRVIDAEEIRRMNALSLNDVLKAFSSVNLIERGTPGSQTDIEINGSSGESVIILLNGIRIHDPQTGHFTLDVPVDTDNIARLELLSGGGASYYGSSTSGGIINIVTKDAEKGFNSRISGGSFGSADLGLSYSTNAFTLNLKSGRSDGYRRNSDFQSTSAFANGSFLFSSWNFLWNTGFELKKFGAEDFYSNHPSYEETSSLIGGVHAIKAFGESIVRVKANARGHGDDFVLIRNNPDYYRNTHYNRNFLFSSEYLRNLNKQSSIIVGAESEISGISSGSLGIDRSDNNAVYGRYSFKGKKITSLMSLRYDSGYRNEKIMSPSLGITIPVSLKTKFSVSAEKTFRSPNYTELYYSSPGNLGNPMLKSEHAQIYSSSYGYSSDNLRAKVSGFYRKSVNVIDWVRFSGETDWKAENQGEINTNGIESDVKYFFNRSWQSGFNVVILNQSVKKEQGIESKYSLRPLGKTIGLSLTGNFLEDAGCSVFIRHEQQIRGETRTPVNIAFSKNIGNIKTLLSIKNVFNEHYQQIPGLPVPGRWFEFKMEYSG